MTVNAKVVVLKGGKPIFEHPIVVNEPGDFSRGSHDAIAVFHLQFPAISLLDDGVMLKFEKLG